MKKEIMIAGFGGQGVMAIGKSLVEAGMGEGREVSWVPSYGPERRGGGTSNCSVILSDEPIGSPLVYAPSELIAMNGPSLKKFEDTVQSGGIIFVNGDSAKSVHRQDVSVYSIPCDKIANGLGNPRVANMVMLGAYASATGAIHKETLDGLIRHMFAGPKAHLISLNLQALQAGMDCVHRTNTAEETCHLTA